MVCSGPERGRKKTFMIEIPRAKRNQHHFKLIVLCLMSSTVQHGIDASVDLDRFLVSVKAPPVKEHTQVVALPCGVCPHRVLERLQVRDLSLFLTKPEY